MEVSRADPTRKEEESFSTTGAVDDDGSRGVEISVARGPGALGATCGTTGLAGVDGIGVEEEVEATGAATTGTATAFG
jgi:hypothetical protein